MALSLQYLDFFFLTIFDFPSKCFHFLLYHIMQIKRSRYKVGKWGKKCVPPISILQDKALALKSPPKLRGPISLAAFTPRV